MEVFRVSRRAAGIGRQLMMRFVYSFDRFALLRMGFVIFHGDWFDDRPEGQTTFVHIPAGISGQFLFAAIGVNIFEWDRCG